MSSSVPVLLRFCDNIQHLAFLQVRQRSELECFSADESDDGTDARPHKLRKFTSGKRGTHRRPKGRSCRISHPAAISQHRKYISLSSPLLAVNHPARAVATEIAQAMPTGDGPPPATAAAPVGVLTTPPASDIKRNPTIRLSSGRHKLLGLPALTVSADHLPACASAVQGAHDTAALEPAAALGPQRAQRVLRAQLDAAGASAAAAAAVAAMSMPKQKEPAASSLSGSSSSESSEVPEILLVENPQAPERPWALPAPSIELLHPYQATPDLTRSIILSTATSQQQQQVQQQQEQQQKMFQADDLTHTRTSSLAQQVRAQVHGKHASASAP